MPLISLKHASPLSDGQVGDLIEALTATYAEITGAAPESVHVLVEQVPADRWGVGGRTLRARRAATNGS